MSEEAMKLMAAFFMGQIIGWLVAMGAFISVVRRREREQKERERNYEQYRVTRNRMMGQSQ